MGDAGRHHRHRSFGSRDLENSGSDASGYSEDNDRDDGTREWDSRADSYSVRSDDPVSLWRRRTGVFHSHAPLASLRDPPLAKRSMGVSRPFQVAEPSSGHLALRTQPLCPSNPAGS